MDTFSIERNKRGIANVWYLAASLAARVATIGENKKKTHAQKHAQEQITSHHLKGVKRSHERDKKGVNPMKCPTPFPLLNGYLFKRFTCTQQITYHSSTPPAFTHKSHGVYYSYNCFLSLCTAVPAQPAAPVACNITTHICLQTDVEERTPLPVSNDVQTYYYAFALTGPCPRLFGLYHQNGISSDASILR